MLQFQDINFSYLINYVTSKKINDQVQLSGEDSGENHALNFLQGIQPPYLSMCNPPIQLLEK